MGKKSDAPKLTKAVGRFFREIINSNGYSGALYAEIVQEMAVAVQYEDPNEVIYPAPPVPPAQAPPIPEEDAEEAK